MALRDHNQATKKKKKTQPNNKQHVACRQLHHPPHFQPQESSLALNWTPLCMTICR